MVLVIDEAQALAPEVLEELRLFSNVNAGRTMLLQTVLVGQLALARHLAPSRRCASSRSGWRSITCSRRSTGSRRRPTSATDWRLAGPGREDLFTADACDAIFTASGGIPRVINLLCDTALVYGYADQKQTIDATTVNEMLGDKAREGGWLFSRPSRRRSPREPSVGS